MHGYNFDRRRYYGLRIGDIVKEYPINSADENARMLVIKYDPMDNNCVVVLDDEGIERMRIAEHLTVVNKIEDQNKNMGPPYPSLAARRVLFLLSRGWHLNFEDHGPLYIHKDNAKSIVRPNVYSAMRRYDLLQYTVEYGAYLAPRGLIIKEETNDRS